jgi:CRP/FNR family cyclic AMP-dependent transcriptional regulator
MTGNGSPFDRLPAPAREALTRAGQRRQYQRGEILFHQGDVGDVVHIVRSGRVAVRVATPAGDTVTLAVMGLGELFGEMALFSDEHERTASIAALEAVETLALRRAPFDEVRAAHRAVDDALLEAMARRVDHLSQLVAEAHFVPAERRVARRLYEVGRLYLPDGIPVTVPLTQEDLAAMAGTTRPTANQALQRLSELGVISSSRGKIAILEPQALRQRAGW